MAVAIVGRDYLHRKGGHYKVLGLAEHSETSEEMVVYERMADQKLYVRPRWLFEDGRFAIVENRHDNGPPLPRHDKMPGDLINVDEHPWVVFKPDQAGQWKQPVLIDTIRRLLHCPPKPSTDDIRATRYMTAIEIGRMRALLAEIRRLTE